MFEIALCDDDVNFLQEFSGALATLLQSKNVSYHLSSFTTGQKLLDFGPYDLIFLDIEMEGIDGMETARKLRKRGDSCTLIFLTAHRKYVFSAFDVEAYHYLTKPIDYDKLEKVLSRLFNRRAKEANRYIHLKQGATFIRVCTDDILYIEVFDRKLFIHTINNTYDFYGKLGNLEQDFPDNFFRCHRSYIVNLSYVKRYDKTAITLLNDETVLISKRKYGEFCKCFLNYLKGGGNPI